MPNKLTRQRLDDHIVLAELSGWVLHWANQYNPGFDEEVTALANPEGGYLTPDDLKIIFEWKLQSNHFVGASRSLAHFEQYYPGQVEKQTAAAAEAATDAQALRELRGLPQMKTAGTVAVASCVLMVLDPDRYTVMDRRANQTLVALRTLLLDRKDPDDPLSNLAGMLRNYMPPAGFVAIAADWPAYVAICRELAKLTGQSLRVVDRALYSSLGNLIWMSRDGDSASSEGVR